MPCRFNAIYRTSRQSTHPQTNRHLSQHAAKMITQPRTHADYTVGWICALSLEFTAARAMLDEMHPKLPSKPNDPNTYTFGQVGAHNIIVACLPKGYIGNNPATAVAVHMTSSFPSIKFGMMVGIGGGVPSAGSNDVRLGDVVVSIPTRTFGGVVQWDLGKALQGHTFERRGSLSPPPKALLSALNESESDRAMTGSKIPQYLDDLKTKWPLLAPKYCRSESLKDVLFEADCEHIDKPSSKERQLVHHSNEQNEGDEEGESCIYCDRTRIVRRRTRAMRVHYGLIASGNQVIKDAQFRDWINKELGGEVLCFEMEAAGLMNDFPCLVIRGICDYADAHKTKDWQEHAAAVAAAFSKELLTFVAVQEVEQMPAIKGGA